jgi:hypothetical protein
MVVIGVLGARFGGAEGMAAAYLLASLSLPAWYLPMKFHVTMRELGASD